MDKNKRLFRYIFITLILSFLSPLFIMNVHAYSWGATVTLYAQWDQKPSYTLTANANRGTIGAPANSTVMAIGTNPSGSSAEGAYFGGKVYSVRIYNGALPAEKIYRNYLYDKQLYHLE